jgi:hypothetical protein
MDPDPEPDPDPYLRLVDLDRKNKWIRNTAIFAFPGSRISDPKTVTKERVKTRN